MNYKQAWYAPYVLPFFHSAYWLYAAAYVALNLPIAQILISFLVPSSLKASVINWPILFLKYPHTLLLFFIHAAVIHHTYFLWTQRYECTILDDIQAIWRKKWFIILLAALYEIASNVILHFRNNQSIYSDQWIIVDVIVIALITLQIFMHLLLTAVIANPSIAVLDQLHLLPLQIKRHLTFVLKTSVIYLLFIAFLVLLGITYGFLAVIFITRPSSMGFNILPFIIGNLYSTLIAVLVDTQIYYHIRFNKGLNG